MRSKQSKPNYLPFMVWCEYLSDNCNVRPPQSIWALHLVEKTSKLCANFISSVELKCKGDESPKAVHVTLLHWHENDIRKDS